MPIKDPVKAREYHKKYHDEWYKRNKKQQVLGQKKLRAERRKWVGLYKVKKGCSICGFNKSSVALDLHHSNGDKEYGVSRMIALFGIERIKEEVVKCQVLCRNCHAILHWDKESLSSSSA